MLIDKAYYVGAHRYLLKSGIPAEIIGVHMVTPEDLDPRLYYHIRWADLTEDWVPIADSDNYKIISFEDIFRWRYPRCNKIIR